MSISGNLLFTHGLSFCYDHYGLGDTCKLIWAQIQSDLATSGQNLLVYHDYNTITFMSLFLPFTACFVGKVESYQIKTLAGMILFILFRSTDMISEVAPWSFFKLFTFHLSSDRSFQKQDQISLDAMKGQTHRTYMRFKTKGTKGFILHFL